MREKRNENDLLMGDRLSRQLVSAFRRDRVLKSRTRNDFSDGGSHHTLRISVTL